VFGIEMDVKDKHPLQQQFPVEATVFGIEIDVNDKYPLKQ
jgi:hypothetical protein